MEKRPVGRPKKTIRNPFIFNDSTQSVKFDALKKASKFGENKIEPFYRTNLIDTSANYLHIDSSLLNHFKVKGTPPGEIGLFFYIISKLYSQREQLRLNHDEVSSATGFSKEVISRSITELIKMDIIRRIKGGKGDTYWINPIKIFKGNRLSYVRSHANDEEYDAIVNVMTAAMVRQLEEEVGF